MAIKRKDIAELRHNLGHTPYQANRTPGVLSKMFNLSEEWGLRPDGGNPCLYVKKYTEQKRGLFLSPEAFAALGGALREAGHDRHCYAWMRKNDAQPQPVGACGGERHRDPAAQGLASYLHAVCVLAHSING